MTADRHTDPDALRARLGSRFAQALAERGDALPDGVAERLRVAREQAVARARGARRRAPALALAGGGMGGAPAPWWQRAAAALPLAVLVGGLLLVEHWAQRERVRAAEEIDALLLADDLPPAAYSDPGFAEFLRNPPP